MSIDTPQKRASALDHEEYSAVGGPLPTGTPSAAIRQHSLNSYSGILAAPVGGSSLVILDRAQFRRVFSFIFGRVN